MYTLIDTIQQETGYIRSMAVIYGWVLLTGSDNSLVRVWRKGHAIEHFSSSSGPINAMVLQYPEARIFCAHDDGAITVWERITGGVFKKIKRLQTVSDFLQKSISFTHDKAVSCLCLSGDGGEFIYSGSKDHTVKVWRIRGSETWKLVETIRDHKGPIDALATQASALSSASSDGTMNLWIRELYGKKEDKVRHKLKRTCVFSGAVVNTINLDVDDFMYAGLSDGKVLSWRLHTMLMTKDDKPEVMSIHKAAVTCLASLHFGPFVFSGSVDMNICVWRRQLVGRESFGSLHTLVMVLTGHSGPVRCIETDFDWEADATGARGRWVVYSASTDGALKVWRVYDRPMPRQYVSKSEHRLQVELRRLRSI
ncbi:WD repeat-containing protein 5 [Carex littledalei]|uniref:WD repeat-containing protein 5 n=1 Tax=Carex littledalei TaxID=544730 RepID=A0A833VQL7_9POAL|nr:WD repeat-containing protein 5 [Carex littledalei]